MILLEKSDKITILFLSWRDIKSPKMGGAEIFTHEMMRNSNLNSFRIIHFSPEFTGSINQENIDGITYVREGNLFNVIFKSKKFYKKNIENINYLIDQCNTHRFFSKFWVEDNKRLFLIFQLTKEIWNYHLKFPFNKLGIFLENFMLKLNKNDFTITESESTKKDLINVGFNKEKIKIIPIGLNFKPWDKKDFFTKELLPTFIYVGRFAKYKGIDTCIKAFGMFKKNYNNAKLWIVGKIDERYFKKSLLNICLLNNLTFGDSSENNDIIFYGFVDEKTKLELISKAHALLFPSIREGWGIIITEAAAVGTPSLVYNSPGLVDAVNYGEAGYIVVRNDEHGLFRSMTEVMENKVKYEKIRQNALAFSNNFSWERTGRDFTNFIINLDNLSSINSGDL